MEFQLVARWASFVPALRKERVEDGLPSDTSSWLYDAIITFRVTLQYPAWRDPVSLGTQVLLLQAKEELGGLLEPDADTQALEDLITPAARQRVSELRRHGQLADAGADPHTINTSGLATHDSPSIAAEPSASAAHAPPAHPRRPSARGRSSGGPLAGLLAMRAGQQSAGGTLTPEQQALTQTTLARASCSPSSLAFLGGISSTSTDLDILDSSCTRQLLQDVMELEADMPLSNWGTGSAESSLAEPAIPGLSMHGIMEPDLGIATGSYSHAGTTRTILSHPMLQMQPSALSGPAWADSSNTWPAMEIHGPAGGALPPSVHTGGSPAVDWRNVRSAIHSTAGGMLPPSASLGPPAVEQRNFGEAIPSDDSRVLPDPNMESVPHWKQVQSDMPDPASRTPPPSAFSLTDMTNSSGAGLGASRPALGGLPSTGLATAPPDWDGTWREGPSPHVPSRLLFGSIGATSADQGSALPRLPDRRPAWSYPTSPATLPPLGIGTSPWLAIHGPDTDMLASTSPRAVLADRSASWPGGPLDSSSGAPLPQGGHPGADDLQAMRLAAQQADDQMFWEALPRIVAPARNTRVDDGMEIPQLRDLPEAHDR
ncbi:hypothetical protein WJX84_010614 [Apatococcus fuscideae]|uniref:Uncharacterized protein n=1 Tax=Apatococcus fuscideae TaxID=2026836 RepID=A0AAW1T5R6_9CHLO